MSLEEAIQQLITLGEKDPLVIARKIEERNDHEWLSEQLFQLREELVSELARQRLGSLRRSSVAMVVARTPTKREVMLAPMWVPGAGWKRLADCTADDFRARQRYYLRVAAGAAAWAQWCLDCIESMEAQGVAKFGQLKGELPSVPEIEEAA